MILLPTPPPVQMARIPRESGDDPVTIHVLGLVESYSPRERG